MRILFSSDLHGDFDAFAGFSSVLENCDLGILAGDLIDEYAGISDLDNSSDFVEEIGDPDDLDQLERLADRAVNDDGSSNRRALVSKRDRLVEVLEKSRKSIYLVHGNHDIQKWVDTEYITVIENRVVQVGDFKLAGVRSRFQGFQSVTRDFRSLSKVDDQTLLVCHEPPYGILDGYIVDGHIRNAGSRPLARFIARKSPRAVFFGHMHSSFGSRGKYFNGSYALSKQFIIVETSDLSFSFA